VRHARGLHYVVSGTPADELRVLDPTSFEPVRILQFDAGSNPQDVVIAGASVFVSFFDRSAVRRFDLATGDVIASIDLAPFADGDGMPEAGRMIRDRNHLFVQCQRLDRSPQAGDPVRGMIAVIDERKNELVDADPTTPGAQAIALEGFWPRLEMQIEGRRLYVSVPGGFHDQSGGIEAVDLDALRSLGFAYVEKQIGAAQMSAFLLVSPTRGYFVHHTDLTQSSHLVSFARATGSFIAEHFVSFGLVERLAHDATTGSVFFPDNDPTTHGIRVFDAATGAQLTMAPVNVGLPPADLVVARADPTDSPGGVRIKIHAVPNPTSGPMRLHWESPPAANLRWSVIDARGRSIFTAPPNALSWSGHDAQGRLVPAGVYFLRLVAAAPEDASAGASNRTAQSTTRIHVIR
jgi:hypothetical protein